MIAKRRRSAFADRLLDFPEFVFSDGREFSRHGAWREFFSQRLNQATFDGRVICEIGCNDAALLTTVAAKHPATAFVGIDWKCRALHAAAVRIAAAGSPNVALVLGRGQDAGRIFGPREVDEVWLFHPDPCDKPRERPNRLFAKGFLDDAAGILRGPRSSLVLKTDHREYFEEAVSLAATAMQFEVTTNSEDYWFDAGARDATKDRLFAGEPTSFEERFLRRKKPIHYLELRLRHVSA
jgi:tRNA G46 methylase TrmB